MVKVLEKIIKVRLSYLTTNLLPPEQFGGREGYSAPDAVLHLLYKGTDIKGGHVGDND
jgi:hypothetical protein